MKTICLQGGDIASQLKFDVVSKGKYWIQNFWGCQVRMEKSEHAIGWGDRWFVEVYYNAGLGAESGAWVSTCAFQPTRRDCVDYLLRIAKASLEGKPTLFMHHVMIDDEGMWAGSHLPHPYFKTVLQPKTRRRVVHENTSRNQATQ